MTNAIEQAKREMYGVLSNLSHLTNKAENKALEHYESATLEMQLYQCKLESYLELLRQDHEALHETARARFEDTRKLEAANQELSASIKNYQNYNSRQADTISSADEEIADLESRLAKMTEERDSIQLRLHAVDHAYSEQQSRAGTSGQYEGDRVACAAPDAKTIVILGAVVAVRDAVSLWGMQNVKAKKAMRMIAGVVNGEPCYSAMLEFDEPARCMRSFFAIENGQMKCTFCGVGK